MAICPGNDTERQAEPQTGPRHWRTGQLEGQHVLHGLRENGKCRTQSADTTPREALDAWMLRTRIQSGETEAPVEVAGSKMKLTIDQSMQDYLVDVRATNGDRTYKVYGGNFSGSANARTIVTSLNSSAPKRCRCSPLVGRNAATAGPSTRRPLTNGSPF